MKKLLLAFLWTLNLCTWVNAAIIPLTNNALSAEEYLEYIWEGRPSPPYDPYNVYKLEFKPEGYEEAAGYIAFTYRQSFPNNPTIFIYGFSIVVYENSPIAVTQLSLNFGNAPLFFDFGTAEGNSFWGSGFGWDGINTDPYNPPLSASFDNVSNVVSFSDVIGPGQKSSCFLILSAEPLKNIRAFKFHVTTDGSGTLTVPLPSIGSFRPSTGEWFLDLNGNGAWDGPITDLYYADFGKGLTGAIPVVGDWGGSESSKLGIYWNGSWYLDLNGNGMWDGSGAVGFATFGVNGDWPVAGQW